MLTEKRDYNEIYKECKNLVLKAAYTYSGNYDVAEDITQNTFLQLYIYFDEMNQSNIKSWLYTTAKNFALNHNKKASREVLSEEFTDDDYILEKIDSAEDSFMYNLQDEERSELHAKIFEKLLVKNRRWYEAITLVYLLEIPQAKVAEEMGMRIEVLHSILHRAKDWIKKNFGVEYDELKRS